MKYESSIPYHSKVMDNIKDFWRQTGRQTDGAKTIYQCPGIKIDNQTWGQRIKCW